MPFVGIIFTGVAIFVSPFVFRGQNYIKNPNNASFYANIFQLLLSFADFFLTLQSAWGRNPESQMH
jgi:hypothetical protein